MGAGLAVGAFRKAQKSMAPTAFEDTGRAIEQRALPVIDHRRVHTEPARQFRHGLLALSAPFVLNSGACCFRCYIANHPRDEDQQTAKAEITAEVVSEGTSQGGTQMTQRFNDSP